MNQHMTALIALAALFGASACAGTIDRQAGGGQTATGGQGATEGARRTPGAGDEGSPATGSASPVGDFGPPGATPMRRLTAREYNNTVRDLLGTASKPLEPPAAASGGFDTNAEAFSISTPVAEQYLTAAEGLAKEADLTKLAPCDAAKGEPACARVLIEQVGRRAFRRPLEKAEADEYAAFYARVRTSNDQPTSLRAVLTRLLIAPEFLYQVERGEAAPPDGSAPLVTPWELAARLSYLLWQSMPDDKLFAAAESGALRNRAAVLAEARRMLADPRARETLWHFHEQWLELHHLASALKDATIYKGWNAIKPDLVEGTRRLVEDLVLDQKGDLSALLTTARTFANGRMAPLYGYAVTGTDFTRVDLDARQSGGALVQPAVLAALGKPDKSAPVLRGVFVRERILCAPVPPPPPNAANALNDAPAARTTREYFANLTVSPACSGCHAQINPIGFAFENFDGIGKWRDTENRVAIDASGTIDAGDAKGSFEGAADLARLLARSRDVEACFARQWFRFGYRRNEVDGDEAFIRDIADRFRASGRKVSAMPEVLTQIEPFYRLHHSTRRLP